MTDLALFALVVGLCVWFARIRRATVEPEDKGDGWEDR